MLLERVLFEKRKLETDRYDDENKWEKLFDDLEKAFPNAPFTVSCVDDMDELEQTFPPAKEIKIYDHRFLCNDIALKDGRNHHQTIVRQKNNKPITIRQVIKAMINDEHYHDDVVKSDPHRFLEGFARLTNKGDNLDQYILVWGS